MLAFGSGQWQSTLKQKSVYCTECPKSLEPIASFFFCFRVLQTNALGSEEHTEIIFLYRHDGWTHRQVEDDCINNHPEINSVTHSADRKLLKKLKKLGSMVDKSHLS